MSKPINEPRMVQQALISDEDLSFELAGLVPTANGITNAASTFIDKATKLLLSDKIMLTDEQHTAVTSAIAIAQLTVKEGSAVSKLLRNPTLRRMSSPDCVSRPRTRRMPDKRLYMPRCRTCRPLGKPTGLDEAVTSCTRHANQYPNHQTAWYPTHAQIIVKGTPNDCE